jgi:hypothetical protein
MRKDLGDKVFDVVGQVLWHESLRQVLEQGFSGNLHCCRRSTSELSMALMNPFARLFETERNTAFTSTPIDIAEFQRKQSTFRAFRLSPRLLRLLRHAIPFIGGVIREDIIQNSERDYPIFEVSLPPEISGKHPQNNGILLGSLL